MRARFLSRFEWAGKDVYCYDDLDTREVVYLEGGRDGEEIRRFTPVNYSFVQGRAIDMPPREDIFEFIKKSYSKKNTWKTGMGHIHWANPEE